jgi:hypothetical protein
MDIFLPTQTLPLFHVFASCFTGPSLVLSQITENRKVEARKSLILQHTIFTFGLKKATLRQNPLAYWSSSSQNAWTLLPQKLVMNAPTGSAVVRASG